MRIMTVYCKNGFLYSRRCVSISLTQQLHLTSRNRRSSNNDDYQIIHRSTVPTMHFQKSLLRLPIPELEKTCSRYLRSQKALQNPEEHDKTIAFVDEFKNGIGKELHNMLALNDKANKHTSYISEPWFDMYLSDRASIVLNYNPALAFLPDERKGYGDPVIRTSNLLISSIRFLNTMKRGILEPEVYHMNPSKTDTSRFRKIVRWTPSMFASYAAYAHKAFPLDMSQFKNLFNSTRIPQLGKDVIKSFPDAKHMLMMKKGNLYIFDIYDKDGNLLPPSHIHACVSYVFNDERPPPAFPVSILTSENRDTWAKLRTELISAGNEDTLNLIDGAAFNISFDEHRLDMDPEKSLRTFLYGDGTNRWFDKSFSLIATADGLTGLNFEHAWGDGVAIMRYVNEVSKDITEKPNIHPDSQLPNVDASKLVRVLEFKIPPSVQTGIANALATYKQRTEDLGVDVYQSDVFGKNFCKTYKVSPDAMMQLGFQVANYLQNGHTVATYESCSTSAFKHGRTETVRPATLETTAFCKAVAMSEQKRPSVSDLKKAIHECSSMHGTLTKEAAMGQGFDRHLFGLRKLAEKNGAAMPSIYSDPAYAKINHNILSTSTLSSPYISIGGFAPVVTDGFGVGYQIQDDSLGVVLTSYPPHRNGAEFLECVDKAYKTIHNVLTS